MGDAGGGIAMVSMVDRPRRWTGALLVVVKSFCSREDKYFLLLVLR